MNLISVVAEDGAPVKISLPPVDPLRVIHIDMQVVGSSAGATGDSRKADVCEVYSHLSLVFLDLGRCFVSLG